MVDAQGNQPAMSGYQPGRRTASVVHMLNKLIADAGTLSVPIARCTLDDGLKELVGRQNLFWEPKDGMVESLLRVRPCAGVYPLTPGNFIGSRP